MTTRVPAPTIPPMETGTPPKEWSASILASDSSRDTPGTLRDPQANQGTPNIAERSRKESHATKGPQTVGSHPYSEKKKEEPHVSLPSTELRGAQPLEHTSGVGALPGNLSESSVALLPEEREERAEAYRATSRQRRDTVKPSVGGGEEEPRRSDKEGDAMKIPREADKEVQGPFQPSDVHAENSKPRTEKDVAPDSDPEVGSQQVPDQTEGRGTTSERASAAAGGMVGTAPGPEEPGERAKDREGTATLGQQESPSEGVQDSGEAHKNERGTSSGKVEGEPGGEYHPAQLHPPPPGASVAEYRSSHGQQEVHEVQNAPTTTKTREPAGGEKKPGFMTMMKGEMKIIAGKMSGDEHKVEEGKRLVHGEA